MKAKVVGAVTQGISHKSLAGKATLCLVSMIRENRALSRVQEDTKVIALAGKDEFR